MQKSGPQMMEERRLRQGTKAEDRAMGVGNEGQIWAGVNEETWAVDDGQSKTVGGGINHGCTKLRSAGQTLKPSPGVCPGLQSLVMQMGILSSRVHDLHAQSYHTSE
ncbi:hypothetical protein NDU88_005433 [Pleurodeles waltl]|uniref:Uncharacterized protein n=1 Tax=Pleurodeles waltl TaxID=8319 RepID=A0AAV7L4F3_PLEWA|nr:hypothetical protein NDU88_005433 [Pleurodeles waltl]